MSQTTAESTHSVTTEPAAHRVRVTAGDQIIADSVRAVVLHETNHADRYYLPRDDVDWSLLQTTESRTHCPVKGDADDYWALTTDTATDVAWSYPNPFDYLQSIAGYVAFYSERVRVDADELLPH
ncbi:DUF427 domain-containing protein [Microbacterium sp. EST19A]|uniref:DUF427 domain-containing protein n=1 Tax=Microbacterium sp. EST19A TaxID=2862681 RepID=UPI001CBC3302|nr:DUF427 domain-containing protein [Microbacterium sp. EST19A]